MSGNTEAAVVMAFVPFVTVWALMRVRTAIERRRDAAVARQIALTDAIHRELGAVAAPVVVQGWVSGWTVTVPLPLHREATVGAIVRIATNVFRRLDGRDSADLRVVLVPRDASREPIGTAHISRLTRAGLSRAA